MDVAAIGRWRARPVRALALVGSLALACAGCLRSNAQGDDRNPNGPGNTNAMPHNTSGPGVTATGGIGSYGSERWGPAEPPPAGPLRGGRAGTTFATEQPGSTGAAPGSGNNGWGGPASLGHGVTGNGTGPWTQ